MAPQTISTSLKFCYSERPLRHRIQERVKTFWTYFLSSLSIDYWYSTNETILIWIELYTLSWFHMLFFLGISRLLLFFASNKMKFCWRDRLRVSNISFISWCFDALLCSLFGATYTKIGTIQRRLAWPLRKDDTQNREAFHIFLQPAYRIMSIYELPLSIFLDLLQIIGIYSTTFWNLSWGCRFKSPRSHQVTYE